MTDQERLWPLLADSEIDHLPPPEWLIGEAGAGGVLTNGFSVLYGPSGSYKTFVALSMALTLAAQIDTLKWVDKYPTKTATVIYISGEGAGGISQRRTAWNLYTRVRRPLNWYLIPFPVSLLSREHTIALQSDVYATGARLIVVDTLARSLVGGDENSAQDMGAAIANLDRIRHETGCAVLVVHHTGVEQSRPRGSTALFAAADTVIECTAEGEQVTLRCRKQKDASEFLPIALRARVHGPSVALEPTTYVTPPSFSPLM